MGVSILPKNTRKFAIIPTTILGCLLLVVSLFMVVSPVYGADSTELLREVRTIVKENYIYPVGSSVLNQNTVEGIMSALDDPYSGFLSEQDLEALNKSTGGSYAGVGMELNLQPYEGFFYPTVISTFPNSPARKGGILPGDRIIAVDGKSVAGYTIEYSVSLIKGKPGTKVALTISRDGRSAPLTVLLLRDKIHVYVVSYEMLEDNIGYIYMSVFSATSGAEVRTAVEELAAQGCKGVILDLRGNPGGFMDAGVDTAAVFVPEGRAVLHIISRNGTTTMKSSDSPMEIPLVVLINGDSASAAEIVAGAVKDYGVGIIVGTTTYGKGTIQVVHPLKSANAALKFTIAEYFSPNGNKINGVGITPDVYVAERDQQLEAARDVLQGQLQDIGDSGVHTLILDPFKGAAYVDGLQVADRGQPYIENNVVMVPLRMVSDFLGAGISWNQATKTVVLDYQQSSTQVVVGSRTLSVDSQRQVLVKAPRVIEGRVYVPLRMVSLFDDISVEWDSVSARAEVVKN